MPASGEPHALPLAGCTLPTAEQPLRVRELEALLSEALLETRALTPTRVVLRLRPEVTDRVRDLVARESACCAFFTFDVREQQDAVELEVGVPAERADVLARLVQLAECAGG